MINCRTHIRGAEPYTQRSAQRNTTKPPQNKMPLTRAAKLGRLTIKKRQDLATTKKPVSRLDELWD